jgi:hypothetical protein
MSSEVIIDIGVTYVFVKHVSIEENIEKRIIALFNSDITHPLHINQNLYNTGILNCFGKLLKI